MATSQAESSSTSVFEQMDRYNWDEDKEFQAALSSILRSATTPEQAAHLKTRARCYYFTRKFKIPVKFDEYQSWQQSRPRQQQSMPEPEASSDLETQTYASTMGDAPSPASFAEICELIASGKPIPGIKDIPDTVLEGKGTESQATRRKKPWEKDATSAPTPSWATKN